MNQKDYQAIAGAFALNNGAAADFQSLRLLAQQIACVLAQDNPEFNRANFLRMCGFDPTI